MKPCNNFDRTGERYVETRQQITVSLDQQRQFSGWKWHYKNPTSCFILSGANTEGQKSAEEVVEWYNCTPLHHIYGERFIPSSTSFYILSL
ncbi:hypothetical protein T4A_7892 [Trichinella pseudospiralis]|uniref:Uncharacterized protein n=1 Tax=Trichinella pseudospiralis TaxID=6337 RepID=A0A0V1ERL6_TRIPS|nr:hypothetical protein T4A_7892 [Trichinella pseudospiralis]